MDKIHVTAKVRSELFRVQCQNSAIKMTNGIRKVRNGVNIFDERSLDSCKIHLRQILVYGMESNSYFRSCKSATSWQKIRNQLDWSPRVAI